MTPELESLNAALLAKLTEIVAAVGVLSEGQLNQAPDVIGANSCFVIATHVFGNMRASVLGIACGMELARDRASEFGSHGSLAELQAAGGQLSKEVVAALSALNAGKLDERVLPSQELWGEGTPREQSRRDALIHPLEHAGIHLGQILLTVDILRQAR